MRRPSGPVRVRGLTMSRSTFAGFCLTAFACGIVTTVAVDRVRFQASDDVAARVDPPRAAAATAPAPAEPGRAAEPRVLPEIRVLPAAEPTLSAPATEPAVARSAGHRAVASAPEGAVASAPERAVASAPERAVASSGAERAVAPPPARAEAPVRRQVARDVAPPVQPVRKRRATAPASSDEPSDPPPTEKWNDPFE